MNAQIKSLPVTVPSPTFDLLLLATIWGASFLFIRMAVGGFGPFTLVEVRVALASLALLPLVIRREGLAAMRENAPMLLAVGVLNSALPFVLFSYGALALTAGFLALLNATTPLWTAVIGRVFYREAISPRQWIGLALGALGVAVLVWGKVDLRPGATGWAVLATLTAPISYGVAAHLARRRLKGVSPLVSTTGSQIAAALALLPLAATHLPAQMPAPSAIGAAVGLALFCTALAYVLYFRLIARSGATRAASVTFLVPAFAALWGVLILDEQITAQMVAGGAVVLCGTALVLGLWPRRT